MVTFPRPVIWSEGNVNTKSTTPLCGGRFARKPVMVLLIGLRNPPDIDILYPTRRASVSPMLRIFAPHFNPPNISISKTAPLGSVDTVVRTGRVISSVKKIIPNIFLFMFFPRLM